MMETGLPAITSFPKGSWLPLQGTGVKPMNPRVQYSVLEGVRLVLWTEGGVMSDSKSLFAAVIEEHLALKRRNAHLNGQRPLSAYEVADPFDNHALFKSEAEARREE